MAEVILTDEQLITLQKKELEIVLEMDRICRKHEINYFLGYGSLIGAIRHKGFIPWDDDIDVCMLRDDYIRFREVCKNELDSRFFYQSKDTDPEYYHLFDKIRMNETLYVEDLLAEHNIHHGVYIDIFPFDFVPESELLRKLQLFKLHFYRTGLMVKYMSMKQRKGKKLAIAKILRVLYMPFPLEYLYKKSHAVAQKYNNEKHSRVYNYCSSFSSNSLCALRSLQQTIDVDFEGYMLPVPIGYDEFLRIQYGDYMKLPPENKRIHKHQIDGLKL